MIFIYFDKPINDQYLSKTIDLDYFGDIYIHKKIS